MASLTVQLPDLQAQGPVLRIQLVGPEVRGVELPIPAPANLVSADAMIDTGASGTVIGHGLASRLGLEPVGSIHIHTPSSTNVPCYRYYLRLVFPNSVSYEGAVIEAPIDGQQDYCLIGRDILAQAVLVYLGHSNLFSLSF